MNPGVKTSTWVVGIFMMLTSCVAAGGASESTRMRVSEAYSHHDSSTTLYSSDNYLKCNSDEQLSVSSTEEISDLIKRYTSRTEPVKIRATRRGFHSSLAFVCSGKRGSSHPEYHEFTALPDHTAAITVLLHLMNRVVSVDGSRHQLTVEAGMTLRELTLAAEANAMSVPAGALSIYANLTVGGSILASAHGSGYRTTSSLSDLVRKVKWVNAKGEILLSDVKTERGAKEVNALVEGLGLLGIVTELTLQLQANSRTVVEVRKGLKDGNIAAELKGMLEEETPHVTAFWRPDFGTYKAVLWKQVEEGEFNPATMPKFYPNGSIALINPFNEEVATAFKEVMAAWEDDPKDESPSADVVNAGKQRSTIANIAVDFSQPQ